MKIGLVVDELARGGTERQFTLLAAALANAGCTVGFFVLRPIAAPGQAQLDRLLAAGVQVTARRGAADATGRPSRLAARTAPLGAYSSWVRRFQPDVVMVAMLRTSLLAAAYSLRPGAPALVMSRRYLASAREDSPLRTRLTRAALRRADAIVANSDRAAADSAAIEGVPRSRYTVIANIVDESAFAPAQPATVVTELPVVVNVASLRPQKGHTHLVEAARLLAQQGEPVTVVALGDDQRWPATAAAVREQIKQADVDVRLLGDVADPRAFFEAADVVVQASVAEGLSNALLEAMAAGRPIVATDAGGTSEVLGGADAAGIVVPVADPQALAVGIRTLLTDRPRAAKLGQAARRRARSQDAPSSVAAHLALFTSVLH